MPTANGTCKKLAVQWLNGALCFVSSSLLADSFELRNRQLLLAIKSSPPPSPQIITSIAASILETNESPGFETTRLTIST
jgi:hypothetical protein